jgi:23S rRNA (guanosine2251-2'-O)-methyltransferase
MKGKTVIFGRKPVLEMLTHAPERLQKIYVDERSAPDAFPAVLAALLEKERRLVTRVPRSKLDAVAPGNHQGIAALCAPAGEAPLERIVERAAASPGKAILVLDEVSDPQNLGSILRAAEAFDVAGVVLTRRRSAGVTSTVSRVSAGASELVQIATVQNLQRALEQLKAAGVWVVGAAIGPGAAPIDRTELAFPLALVLGSEGEGLRRLTKKMCDELVEIVLPGRMQSLNVNQAASVLLYEASRQWGVGRTRRGGGE